MKKNVPFKALSFLFSLLVFSFASNAQLNPGSIAATSICTERNTDAPDIINNTLPSSGTAPYTYQWEAKIDYSGWAPVVSNGNGDSYSPGMLSYNTNFRRKVTDANGNIAYSNEVRLYLTEGFTAGQIRLDNAVKDYNYYLPGSPIDLMIAAGARYGTDAYSYQWETATALGGPWSAISGENGLTYQSPAINTVGSYFFRIKATDDNCGNIAYSDVIHIQIVTTLPFFQGFFTHYYPCVFPNNTPSLLQGSLAIGGTGPYTYEWEKKGESDLTWQTIANSNTLTYQPGILTETTKFRRKATDANGNTGYTNESSIYIVTTVPNPGMIATNETAIAPNAPYDAAINIQSASNFWNAGYAWQKSLDGGNTWTEINDYSYSTYFPPVTPTVVLTCYRRSIREYCATNTRDTWTNTICIQPALPLTDGTISINGGNTACNTPGSQPLAITGTPATGGSTPYVYKWQTFDGTNWVDIANTNNVSYTPPVLNYSAKYRRIVTDANNTSLTSNEVLVSIQSNSPLRGGLIDGPIVTCSNTAPGIINNIIDACGGGGVFTYSWEASTNNGPWTIISGADQPTYNATNINETTKYRRKIGDGCGGATYSNEVEVFVYPPIEGGTITPAVQNVCTNETPELLGLTQNCHYTNGNVTYQWQRATSPSGPWTNMNGATQAVLLPKASNTTAYYRLVVKSSVCNAEAVSTVSVVNVNACSPKAANTATKLAATNLSTRGDMRLYPNPVTKGQTVYVTFSHNSNTKNRVTATLRSIDGRTFNTIVEGSSNKGIQIKIPANIVQGTYLMQVTNGEQKWIERIVIL